VAYPLLARRDRPAGAPLEHPEVLGTAEARQIVD